MRPGAAAVLIGSAMGGPSVLAQVAHPLPAWLPSAMSLIGTLIVGSIAWLWKRAELARDEKWVEVRTSHEAVMGDLRAEVSKLREWRHSTAADLVAVRLALQGLPCQEAHRVTCPEESPDDTSAS